MAAHGAPFVAQASPHLWKDLMRKVQRALEFDGPSFINLLAPCPRGWRTDAESGVLLGRVAVETCVWPIYEVDRGTWKLNVRPREKKPVTEWLKLQGRFAHLRQPDRQGDVERVQQIIDKAWEELLERCTPPAQVTTPRPGRKPAAAATTD
jgi:pyruvate ferredoxin oxidoreductase beta subunit